MSSIRFKVTQEDIELGKKSDTGGCAIARALKKQCNTDYISVSSMHIMINGTFYPTPDEMSRFVFDFDKDKTLVFPTEFLLDTTLILPKQYVNV